MKYIVIGLTVLWVLFGSCTKDKEKTATFCTDGFIYWGGDPAVDGSGWYFSTRTNRALEYPLLEIADSLQTDSLPVHLCLQKSREKYYCFCPQDLYYYTIISAVKN